MLVRGMHYEGSPPIFPIQDINVFIDGTYAGRVGGGPYVASLGIMRLAVTLGEVVGGKRDITVVLDTSTPQTLTCNRVVQASSNRLPFAVTCANATSYWYGIGTQDAVSYSWELDISLIRAGLIKVNENNSVVDSVTASIVGDVLHVEASDDTMSQSTKSLVGFDILYYPTVNSGAEYAWYLLEYNPIEWRNKKESLGTTVSLEAITWS